MKSSAVRLYCISALFCGAMLFIPFPASADEGMWTYDNPPVKQLKELYGFVPTREWLDHLRLASLRFNDGGSGSFISATGLVLTNHHVALGQLQNVSTERKNYVRDGFYAPTREEEMKSPDLELDQLVSMQNVTSRVAESVAPGMSDEQALKARKALITGGESAVNASKDPAIELARRVNPVITETQEWYKNNIRSVLDAAGEKLGLARFAVYGKSEYPDANFTLRLAYGTVKGYPMNGTQAPPITTFYGLYDRAYSFGLHHPYNLSNRRLDLKNKFDLSTPFNFVNTCDIVGGNSGSPVVNRKGELVGLIFDGNIESLVGTFVYDERQNRAVAVHSAAIMEALRNIYDASSLADEIERKSDQQIAVNTVLSCRPIRSPSNLRQSWASRTMRKRAVPELSGCRTVLAYLNAYAQNGLLLILSKL